MPASTSDKITDTRNAARPSSARVTSPRNAGGTSLVCDDLSGWSTASKVHFVTYRLDSSSNVVAGSQLDCSGIVSGNTINSLTVIDGTDAGSSVNDVVEMLPTAAWGQDLADALTSQHTRTGAHSGVTNTGGMTTDTLTVSGAASVGGNLSVTGYNQDKGKNLYEIRDENIADYTVSGGVWSGDSYGSTLAASMTAWVGYINGQRGTISAVTARAFTASKDTYVDVLNNSGTFSLVYTEVANNAASPALAANSIRIAIVVSGGSSIAAATSINQGQTDRTVPVVSSVPYTVTDSLGNLIYNLSPNPTLIGYRTTATYGSAGDTSRTGMVQTPFIVPTGRRVKFTASTSWGNFNTSQSSYTNTVVRMDGTTIVAGGVGWINGATAQSNNSKPVAIGLATPSAGYHYATLETDMAGYQMSVSASPTIIVELV